jgi:hypothetical protein
LLLVPEPVQRERATAPAQKQSPAPLPDAARTVPPDRNAPSTPVDGAARDLGFELSLLAGARIGDGQFGAGGGMLSLLEVKRWLVGFQGRIDGCRAVAGGELEAALELGLFAGRRIDVGSFALDLSAGPAVAMKGLASSEKVSVPADGARAAPPPARTTGPVPRLFVGARLGFSPRSVFRWFVGLDGELGPARVGAPTDAASSRLPRFAVGLALGATVGTR